MGQKTEIEWTDRTWNPTTGCTKIGTGCDNCYAERFAERWRGVPGHPYEQGFDLKLWPSRLDQPKKWRTPSMIFVNSMSDLFHKDFSRSYIDQVFDVMEQQNHHVYQVLTKRSSLMRNYLASRYLGKSVPTNIWLGVSVEDKAHSVRIKHLLEISSQARFISFEPLLSSVGKIDLKGIAWAIVGGESGPKSRPIKAEWVIEIKDMCERDEVSFFFKQWGGIRPKSGGRSLDGREWNGFPWKIVPKNIIHKLDNTEVDSK